MRDVCRFHVSVALAAVVSLSSATGLGQVSPTGKINGIITDEKGKPLANVAVTCSIVPSTPPIAAFAISTRTDKDGGFQASGLPAGTYQVCAQIAGSAYVDSCLWGTPAATAAVTAGAARTLQPVMLTPGHKVHIRVDDPRNLLEANEGPTRGAHLTIGVWNKKLLVPVFVVRKDATGRDYQTYVPEGTDLVLSVFSRFFLMGDSQGSALAKSQTGASSANVPFRASAGEGTKEFSFRVNGKN